MPWILAALVMIVILNRKISPASGATGQQFVSPAAKQAAGQLVRPPVFTPAPQNNIQPEAGIEAQKQGMTPQFVPMDSPYYIAPIATIPVVPDTNYRTPLVMPDGIVPGRILPPPSANGVDVPVSPVKGGSGMYQDYGLAIAYGLPVPIDTEFVRQPQASLDTL